ncbi:hypothetical protein GJAV_G00109740 [Gymnothorax javanicus]|nr:hypothetical protein GJAV_G00109740 [Gymnothorax javanicus]
MAHKKESLFVATFAGNLKIITVTNNGRVKQRRSVQLEMGDTHGRLMSGEAGGAQDRLEIEESALNILGLVATVLNLVVMLIVYIYNAL